MELQNSLGISHLMLIIFRIVSPVESEGSSAQIAMQILHLILSRHFPQDYYAGLDLIFKKGSGLPHKSINHIGMALSQHGGHGVILRREIKELKIICLCSM